MSAEVSLDSLFAAALEIASAEERAAYLDRACGGAEAVRRRVEQLLEAHDKAGGFLHLPATDLSLPADASSSEEPGTRIGAYKLLQKLGEGGMGAVWVAEQQEPVKRRVAL